MVFHVVSGHAAAGGTPANCCATVTVFRDIETIPRAERTV